MTKEILVPAISSKEEIESKGVKARIDCCNWSQNYNYIPNAEFFIAHTSDALCVKFLVSEKSVSASCLESNGPVYEDSCVECFLKLPQSDYYYNFETNCIGVGLSAKQKARGIEKSFITDKITRVSSLEKKAIDIEDSSWSLYLEIPFSTLGLDSPPKSLLANFYKCGSKTKHYLSWNPINSPEPDFHRPECFGIITLLP